MHRIFKLIITLLFCILLTACGGSKSQPELQPSTQLPGALGHEPAPEGISPELWGQLKSELAASLAQSGRGHSTSAAPSGEWNKIYDLLITNTTSNSATINWTYKNAGDYDLNGEVNIGDLTPIGLYFGRTPQDAGWAEASVADGDGNGEINIADVSPIGQNFGNAVSGYEIAAYNTGGVTQEEPSEDQVLTDVLFAESTDSGNERLFASEFVPATHFKGYLIVRAYHEVAGNRTHGDWSNDDYFKTQASLDPLIATQGTLEDQVQLAWSAAQDIVAYSIQRSDAEEGAFAEIGSVGPTASYVDTTAAAGVHYWYQVVAEADPVFGLVTSVVEGWAAGPPPAPTDLVASEGTTDTGIQLSWIKPTGLYTYNIYRDAMDNLIDSVGDVEAYLDTTTVFPNEHTYWITAVEPYFSHESELAGPVVGNRGKVQIMLVESLKVLAGFESSFSVSHTGGTAPYTFSWDFGGGATPNISTEESPVVSTSSAGDYSAMVAVSCSVGTGEYPFTFEVLPPVTDLLVVYNSDIPESLELAQYYISPVTGRAIHPDYQLGLPLGVAENMSIQRDAGSPNYVDDIRDPIKDFLNANPTIRDDIKYLLLMKGVPHQIPGSGEFDPDNSTYSSVDSELCFVMGDGTYPVQSWLWNGPNFMVYNGAGFYLEDDTDFVPGAYQVSANGGSIYTLDYLVGRLSAYTWAEAKLLVDRSLAAEANANAWVVFDTTPNRQSLDTMVDPVYPYADDSQESGFELLNAAGLNVFADITTTRIINGSAELPGGFTNSVIGYAGWGVNHTGGSYASGNQYILNDLGWNYVPGACFISYESFNGTDFNDIDGITRRGQGQISDFFRRGGTVAIGNVYEPFSLAVGDERWVFDRYINHGDRWIEAAYKGLRLLSWQEVVVGDPLCRVKP